MVAQFSAEQPAPVSSATPSGCGSASTAAQHQLHLNLHVHHSSIIRATCGHFGLLSQHISTRTKEGLEQILQCNVKLYLMI